MSRGIQSVVIGGAPSRAQATAGCDVVGETGFHIPLANAGMGAETLPAWRRKDI
jgi:hypothetical protein